MANKLKLTKEAIRSAFEKISTGLVGLGYLDNAAKQLMQTSSEFAVDGETQKIDWNLVLADHAKKTKEEVNHKSFLKWLGSEQMDEDTGKAMIAYLVSRLSTSLTRVAVLTTAALEEVLESTGLTYGELVKELGISCPENPDMLKNHSMSDAYFEAMRIVSREVMATRGYTSTRDIFKRAKTGNPLGLKVQFGKKKNENE